MLAVPNNETFRPSGLAARTGECEDHNRSSGSLRGVDRTLHHGCLHILVGRGHSNLEPPAVVDRPGGMDSLMLYTVTFFDPKAQHEWQADLLETSWKHARQEGVLVQLLQCSGSKGREVTKPRFAHRVTLGVSASRAPASHDPSALPAALLEWIYREDPQGSVLILPPDCVFRTAVKRRVAPGKAIAQSWPLSGMRKPVSKHPFGFPPGFSFLSKVSSRPLAETTPVRLPVLIHSDDLRRIAPRWLQLCNLICEHCRDSSGNPIATAADYAYLAASAEYGIAHEGARLLTSVAAPSDNELGPLLSYLEPLVSVTGETLFNKDAEHQDPYLPKNLAPVNPAGYEFAAVFNACADANRATSGKPGLRHRPRWRSGVLEGRVMDELMLEIPSEERNLWLNATGKEIWLLCDGSRNIEDIRSEVSGRYRDHGAAVASDVLALIDTLTHFRFLEST